MRVLMWGLATIYTDPPCPPSPPLGPPRGTNFSRRNARQPRPPPPASTWMSTSSTNIRNWRTGDRLVAARRPIHHAPGSSTRQFTLFYRQHADDASVRAVVLELDAACDLGEDRIVFAEAGVQPGPEAPAPLPHDDRA